MDDLQQYTYTNYTHPWYHDRKSWVVIGVGILVVILVVGGAIWFVRARGAARQKAAAELARVAGITDQLKTDLGACDLAADPEACKGNLVSGAALKAQTSDVCVTLSGSALEDCVRDVAVAKKDVAICGDLDDKEARQRCEGRVLLDAANEADDYALCAKIGDDALRSVCESQLLSTVLAADACKKFSVDEKLCLDNDLLAQALSAGDPAICDRLSRSEDAMTCRGDVEASDRDFDHLSLAEERRLGTDPNKADTDGDTFPDGAEVQNGYNPLGTGRLSSP